MTQSTELTLGIDGRPWGTRAALTRDGEIVDVFAVEEPATSSTSMLWRRMLAAIDEATERTEDPIARIRIARLPTTSTWYELAKLERLAPSIDASSVEVNDVLSRRARTPYVATDGRELSPNEVSALVAGGAALATEDGVGQFTVADIDQLAARRSVGTPISAGVAEPVASVGATKTATRKIEPYQAHGRPRALVATALLALLAVVGLGGILGSDSPQQHEQQIPYDHKVVKPVGGVESVLTTTTTTSTTTSTTTTTTTAPSVTTEAPSGQLTDIFADIEPAEASNPKADLTDIFADIESGS